MAVFDDEQEAEARYQQEMQRQAELQQQQEEERRRRRRALAQLKGQARQRAKQVAGRAVKQGAKAAGRAVGTAIAEGLAAIGEAITAFLAAAGPIIGVILIILGLVIVVVVTVATLCTSDSWGGRLARFSSSVTAFLGVTDRDYCKDATLTSLGGLVDLGQVPPPGGEVCDLTKIQPLPAGVVLDCSNCVDITQDPWKIPVKPGQGHFADRGMADLLLQLKNKNATWRVTEAYCPTVPHLDPKHFNGKAVDIGLLPAYGRDQATFLQVYRDAKTVPFSALVCEPASYSTQEITCKTYPTTTDPNIHVESP